MRLTHALVLTAALVGFTSVVATTQNAPPLTGPKLEAKSTMADAIPGVVKAGEKVVLIKDGLTGSDAVVGMPDGTAVLSEQNSPRIIRVAEDDSITTLLEDPAIARALGVDSKGRLIGLMLTTKATKADQVRVLTGPGAGTTLFSDIPGIRISEGRDFVISKKDGIYMTDLGTLNQAPLSAPTWIYYLPPHGTPRRVADERDKMAMPNGIALSPDDRTLYLNDSRGDYIIAWDVKPDGTLSNRRNFGKYQIPDQWRKEFGYFSDGMCVDAAGRVYAGMPYGVQVFSRTGEFLGTIPVTKKVQNVAFAGKDRRTLYIVSQGSIWKVRTLRPGVKTRAK